MAKLGAFFSLCPIIDAKSIYVSEDNEEGIIIVSLGRNSVSRYRVSDQKQITFWRSKEKFSSPVIYHKEKAKYVAVFNGTHVKFWDVNEDNLDKLKKYKFSKQIHTLLKSNDNCFILFQNGSIHKLDQAVEDRKSLLTNEIEINQIDHVLCQEVNHFIYVSLISGNIFYWTKYEENYKYEKIKLERGDLIVKGFTYHVIGDIVYLLTIWSDGSIYSRLLDESSLEEDNMGELFTVIDCISPKHFIAMKSLDENYIALFGANSNEEGAVLAIYNVQFKVTQSRQTFKLFSANSKIWKHENNLFVPVGQNLAVIPFHLETEQLAALVGSHKESQSNLDPDIKIIHEFEVASWDKRVFKTHLPENLKNTLEQFVKQGYSEHAILEELLPEVFKQEDTNLLFLIMRNFVDVPEKFLVSILDFVLDISKKDKLLKTALVRPFSEVLILPYLRSNISTTKILSLLKSIQCLWANDKQLPGLSCVETHAKCLEWVTVLIDSNYQKIVLSNDKIFLETLNEINKLVKDYLDALEDLKSLEPLLISFKNKKITNRCTSITNLRYTVEQISLY
ncbi:nucleolar protein 11 isoform X1 [Diorhabda sublineata]|uniref:nucleolar protein 11 isoform X1 n=1 Tax=Diorhabda sublineata TaxID=1163346 RepID=UPI0024E09F80|nr:nucleolar protein 11 isoform X1 [Diorhabda sublineata]